MSESLISTIRFPEHTLTVDRVERVAMVSNDNQEPIGLYSIDGNGCLHWTGMQPMGSELFDTVKSMIGG